MQEKGNAAVNVVVKADPRLRLLAKSDKCVAVLSVSCL